MPRLAHLAMARDLRMRMSSHQTSTGMNIIMSPYMSTRDQGGANESRVACGLSIAG